MMTQQNVNLLRGAYSAFADGDIESVMDAMHPRIRWDQAEGSSCGAGNPYVGPDGVFQGVFKPLRSDWEYFRIHVEEVFAAGDRVVVLGRYEAIHKGTGKEIDAQFAHVWGVAEGLISSFQQYTDTAQVRDALPGS